MAKCWFLRDKAVTGLELEKNIKMHQKKSQPENRPAPINPITMKTIAKLNTQ